MNYWLLKSEPATWSWEQQAARGASGEVWDGVRNHQAANHMKAMAKGDLALFYHSGKNPAVVGIVEIIEAAYPDPSDDSGRFVAVTVKAVEPLPQPVTLKAIKAQAALRELALVKQPRLSVMPVRRDEWRLIEQLARR